MKNGLMDSSVDWTQMGKRIVLSSIGTSQTKKQGGKKRRMTKENGTEYLRTAEQLLRVVCIMGVSEEEKERNRRSNLE